jgi:hypothetical protein
VLFTQARDRVAVLESRIGQFETDVQREKTARLEAAFEVTNMMSKKLELCQMFIGFVLIRRARLGPIANARLPT